MTNGKNTAINEDFGSWLNQAKQWVGGVGKGALTGTILGKKDDNDYGAEVRDQLYRAEILQSAIFDVFGITAVVVEK